MKDRYREISSPPPSYFCECVCVCNVLSRYIFIRRQQLCGIDGTKKMGNNKTTTTTTELRKDDFESRLKEAGMMGWLLLLQLQATQCSATVAKQATWEKRGKGI